MGRSAWQPDEKVCGTETVCGTDFPAVQTLPVARWSGKGPRGGWPHRSLGETQTSGRETTLQVGSQPIEFLNHGSIGQ